MEVLHITNDPSDLNAGLSLPLPRCGVGVQLAVVYP